MQKLRFNPVQSNPVVSYSNRLRSGSFVEYRSDGALHNGHLLRHDLHRVIDIFLTLFQDDRFQCAAHLDHRTTDLMEQTVCTVVHRQRVGWCAGEIHRARQ